MSATSVVIVQGAGAPSGSASAKRPAKEGFQIPSLDGIRAASFMVVFASHAGLQRVLPAHFGLTLFFFLSGYLITTLLRMEYEKTGDISIRQFYLRRVLRIFPPFYLVLALTAALTALGLLGSALSAPALIAQASHLTNYYIIRHGWWVGMPPGTSVYWSLAVEEHFYLGFPLLYLFLRRRLRSNEQIAAALFSLCALILAWRAVLVFGLDVSRDRTYIATDTRIDSILFGCVLAVWHNPVLDKPTIGDRSLARVWLPLGVAMVILSVVVRQPAFDQTLRYTLQSAGLFPFFIAAVRWHDRGVFRLLNLRPVKYVGMLSYSLYLLHFTVIWGLELHTRWPTPVRGAVALATVSSPRLLTYMLMGLLAGLRPPPASEPPASREPPESDPPKRQLP